MYQAFTAYLYSLPEWTFKQVIGLSRPTVEEFIKQKTSVPKWKPTYFNTRDEIIITLLHLRHYPTDALLAVIFQSSEETMRNTWRRGLKWLYNELKSKVSLQSEAWRKKHGQKIFFTTYTFAIDGSEQRVSASSDPLLDPLFYSVKKETHTVNILVVISLKKKKVLWISPSFPGSYNDNDIAKLTRKDWNDVLPSTEWGLGDAGFNRLEVDGIRITTPGKDGDELNKIISSKRIYVENTFADLKDWRALKDPLRMKMTNKDELLKIHNMYWTIVAVFHNEYK